ncbi:3-5 exonuclease superfamily protein [Fusarium langsethiae]|uniref:3-5 exonuclease superfamily protein n=1 Tax=Fusarium langsethiae TaxID=179993 RepID=A0A0M9F1B9_FUSLA|nr:3-5 exonuclease superfamily protein [Fusarium langsethiae]GKU00954.1 unnamed protein product [Fusarium langsethiae]GKU15373.1 unnamed protein product [Fusarium langsethiae]
MLRSINRLAKTRVSVRRNGLTRTYIAKGYSTETSPDQEAIQEAIEEERMLMAVAEERMKSAAEKARVRSAVEKARLQRKAIEANTTTKVTTSKTTIVKGVAIKRAAVKVVAAKGVATRNTPTRSVPIKPTTLKDAAIKNAVAKASVAKGTTAKDVIVRDGTPTNITRKNTTVKNSTTKTTIAEDTTTKVVITKETAIKNDNKKAAVSKDKFEKKVIMKDSIMKNATTKAAPTKDVTAKNTTTAADPTTATKVGPSTPFRSSRPIGVANKRTPNRMRQQAHTKSKISRKRSQKGTQSSNGPPSEPPLLSELPELTFQPYPSPAEGEPKEAELPRKPSLKQEPLTEDHYQRLRKENLPEEDRKNLAWLKSMPKEEKNEFIKKTYGWSFEVPYSRELYYTPKNRRRNHVLRKRFVALQQLRLIMGHSTTMDFKDQWLEDLPYRLRRTSMRDVRFICIDTDRVRRLPRTLKGETKRRVTSFHLGVAILDTRDIRDVVTRSINLPNPADLIKTYEFAVQTEAPEQDSFIFGETQAISLDGLKKKFIEWQQDRTVIGVAYSARNDYIILRDFDFFFSHVYWVDLCQATYLITQQSKAPSLREVLEVLNIRYSKLHSAGNDAHFTMRALLGLAVLDVTNELQYGGYLQPWCGLAARIAKAPLPLTELEELRAKERQIAERIAATTNWARKRKISNIPLPYPGQD